MDVLRHIRKINPALLLIASVFIFISCNEGEFEDSQKLSTDPIAVRFDIGMSDASTRVFSNTHNVNSILIIPCSSDDGIIFTPLLDMAVQTNVTSFPSCDIKLMLYPNRLYTVLVVGYNSNDYNYLDPGNKNNKFSINLGQPATLSNLNLSLKQPAASPEIFTCICEVFKDNILQGTQFRPANDLLIKGTLKRLTSGISMTITEVPNYVASITLRGGTLCKSVKLSDNKPYEVYSSPTIISTQIPANQTISFNNLILPLYNSLDITKSSELYLDVALGSTISTYKVKVKGTPLNTTSFSFKPNEVYDFKGKYADVLPLGFISNLTVNLDEEAWDGIH